MILLPVFSAGLSAVPYSPVSAGHYPHTASLLSLHNKTVSEERPSYIHQTVDYYNVGISAVEGLQ